MGVGLKSSRFKLCREGVGLYGTLQNQSHYPPQPYPIPPGNVIENVMVPCTAILHWFCIRTEHVLSQVAGVK